MRSDIYRRKFVFFFVFFEVSQLADSDNNIKIGSHILVLDHNPLECQLFD